MSYYDPYAYPYAYGPPQHNPYPVPPPPPPPQHYAHYAHHAYGPPQQEYYHQPEERYVPPSKRHKYNSGYHYPQRPYSVAPTPQPAHAQFSPPPYPSHTPAYPSHTPAYPPPPPSAWAGSPTPVPATPAPNYNVVLEPHAASGSPAFTPEESPPATFGQEDDHHKKYSKNQHNQASHWQAAHGEEVVPGRRFTSLQWKAKKSGDSKSPGTSQSPAPMSATPAPRASTPSAVVAAKATATPGTASTDRVSSTTKAQTRPVLIKTESSILPTTETTHQDDQEQWEFDDYWPADEDKIDDKFSLGTIIWRPAERVKHAISANWLEAEAQELGSVPDDATDQSSISSYITNTNLNDACRPINKSKDWQNIRNDPVFADLTREPRFITVRQLRERRGLRADTPEPMDVDQEYIRCSKITTIPDKSKSTPHARKEVNPLPIKAADEEESYSPPPVTVQHTPSVTSTETHREVAPPSATKRPITASTTLPSSISMSIATPTTSMMQPTTPATTGPRTLPRQDGSSNKITRLSDQEQEDVLAKLGVTGAPKPVGSKPSPPIAKALSTLGKDQEEILAMLEVTGAPKPVGSRPSPPITKSTSTLGRDQEDILAMLGVTGEAKPVRSVPGPSYRASKPASPHNQVPTGTTTLESSSLPKSHIPTPPKAQIRTEPETRVESQPMTPADVYPHYSRQQAPFPPPPPPPPPLPEYPYGEARDMVPTAFDAFGEVRRPGSRSSQHTQAGSDFHAEEPTPEPEVPVEPEGDSEGDLKTPEPDINIGKGSLRARKRSRKQIEADEDADIIDSQTTTEDSRSRGRPKKQIQPAKKRKTAAATS